MPLIVKYNVTQKKSQGKERLVLEAVGGWCWVFFCFLFGFVRACVFLFCFVFFLLQWSCIAYSVKVFSLRLKLSKLRKINLRMQKSGSVQSLGKAQRTRRSVAMFPVHIAGGVLHVCCSHNSNQNPRRLLSKMLHDFDTGQVFSVQVLLGNTVYLLT